MWNIGFNRFSIYINYYDASNIIQYVVQSSGQSQSQYKPIEALSISKMIFSPVKE